MKWIKAINRVPDSPKMVYVKSKTGDRSAQYAKGLDSFYGTDTEEYISKEFIEWLDESDLPNEPSIDISSISEKWVGIWQRGENPNLFQCVDEAIKEALKPQPLQEDCHCTPDQTTGHTGGKCNVCGKDVEEAAIQHADSLHKKGSSELAGNGKLTENDCWENAYFNFKEGQLNK